MRRQGKGRNKEEDNKEVKESLEEGGEKRRKSR